MRDLLKKIYINREMGCLSNMLTTRMFFFYEWGWDDPRVQFADSWI